MAKRKRDPECLDSCATKSGSTTKRKSARLEGEAGSKNGAAHAPRLLSPASSTYNYRFGDKRRKQPKQESKSVRDHTTPPKPSEVISPTQSPPDEVQTDPITHWVTTNYWPDNYADERFAMAESSRKRKSTSTHRSVYEQRMAEQGLIMHSSVAVQQTSKELCNELLEGNHRPGEHMPFPAEKLPEVLSRVCVLNESRLQRDVTPWIVPSAELLFYCGKLGTDYIGDEVDAEWTKCVSLGSTRPKPDYTAGLQRKAFTEEEIKKLENYTTSLKHYLVTPWLCFPFLICEAKTGERGMGEADRQNLHSGSIAVKAIIELFKAAFGHDDPRTVELSGKILVFTISHDHNTVYLYGHFAVATGDSSEDFEYHRYAIALFGLRTGGGTELHRAYNFVCNVYEQFVPEHLQRIKDAVAQLPMPQPRTGLSFGTSDMSLEGESQNESQLDSAGQFKKLASVVELQKILEQQKKDSEAREDRIRQESKAREDRIRQESKAEMEEMRKENVAREERMQQQLEQLMSLLKSKQQEN